MRSVHGVSNDRRRSRDGRPRLARNPRLATPDRSPAQARIYAPDRGGSLPGGRRGIVTGEEAHGDLVAVADAWAAAIVSNDATQIAAFMATDWVIVSESGISSKESFLALVESGELTHSAMDLVTEPRIRVYGDTATLTGRVTNTAHHLGRRFDADEWTTDVFTRENGRWLCTLSHITAAKEAP